MEEWGNVGIGDSGNWTGPRLISVLCKSVISRRQECRRFIIIIMNNQRSSTKHGVVRDYHLTHINNHHALGKKRRRVAPSGHPRIPRGPFPNFWTSRLNAHPKEDGFTRLDGTNIHGADTRTAKKTVWLGEDRVMGKFLVRQGQESGRREWTHGSTPFIPGKESW